MPEAPSTGSLILAYAAAGLFLVGVIVSIVRSKDRAFSMIAGLAGLVLAVAALVWHAVSHDQWLPLEDNFSALMWLGVMVGCVSIYLEARRSVGRVDWALSPIVIVFLLAGAVFGAAAPREYAHGAWAWTHRISVYTGPIALALATSTGILYLVLRSRLRSKHSPVDARFGSLEKLERLTYGAVSVGFALLTVGLVTGVARVLSENTTLGRHWYLTPKVLFSFSAYAVYALVLHSPINPAFRGRRMAILSIAGFVLLLATMLAVQLL